jgi:hypothetical protein
VNIFGCASAKPLIMFVNTPIGHFAGDLMQERSCGDQPTLGRYATTRDRSKHQKHMKNRDYIVPKHAI